LLTIVNKLEEEGRMKTAQFNDLKTQRTTLMKKSEAQSLPSKDLIDVFSPENVKSGTGADDDFIMTEYLTTLIVVLAKGSEQEFLSSYERWGENVVPMSARKFQGMDDKEGNSLWRVIVFKSAADGFKRAARDARFIVRDFEYNAETLKKLKAQRDQVNRDFDAQQKVLQSFCSLAWSDVMVAWVHVKAMRVFVESVLRFGAPPSFASFNIQPQASQTTQARKALSDVFRANGNEANDKLAEAAAEADGEEFYSYVSVQFSPFAPKAA